MVEMLSSSWQARYAGHSSQHLQHAGLHAFPLFWVLNHVKSKVRDLVVLDVPLLKFCTWLAVP